MGVGVARAPAPVHACALIFRGVAVGQILIHVSLDPTTISRQGQYPTSQEEKTTIISEVCSGILRYINRKSKKLILVLLQLITRKKNCSGIQLFL